MARKPLKRLHPEQKRAHYSKKRLHKREAAKAARAANHSMIADLRANGIPPTSPCSLCVNAQAPTQTQAAGGAGAGAGSDDDVKTEDVKTEVKRGATSLDPRLYHWKVDCPRKKAKLDRENSRREAYNKEAGSVDKNARMYLPEFVYFRRAMGAEGENEMGMSWADLTIVHTALASGEDIQAKLAWNVLVTSQLHTTPKLHPDRGRWKLLRLPEDK